MHQGHCPHTSTASTQIYLRMIDLVKVADTISASGVISHKTLKASRSSPPLKGKEKAEGVGGGAREGGEGVEN